MFCGAAQIVINPSIGTYLSGYAADRPCEGIHDSIHAKVLAFGKQSVDMLLVSLDVVAIDADYVSTLRVNIQQKYNVPADKIMVHATHTHSGPGGTIRETSTIWKAFTHWMPYSEELVHNQHEKILEAVGNAIETMEPCTVLYGAGLAEGIAANRITPERDYRPDLQVLAFRKSSGKRIIVYHFACHPTILHAENLQASGDFPGAASSFLEEDEQVETAMFLNGPCGDVSTRFTRRQTNFDEVNRIGKMLCDKVVEVLSSAKPVTASEIISKTCTIELKIRSFDSPEMMEAKLEALYDVFRNAQGNKVPSAELRRMESEIEGASSAVALSNKIRGISSVQVELQLLQLGQLYFVAVPGEMFYETGRHVKDAFELNHTAAHLVLIGNTNDYIGYIVPAKYYATNSYESSMTLLQEDSSDFIVRSIQKELLTLHKH